MNTGNFKNGLTKMTGIMLIMTVIICLFPAVHFSSAEGSSNTYLYIETTDGKKIPVKIESPASIVYQKNADGDIIKNLTEYMLYINTMGNAKVEFWVPDAECAMQLAMIYLSHDPVCQHRHMMPFHVSYYEEYMVWVVCFDDVDNILAMYSDAEEVTVTVGNNICIAIQATDGKVLRVWQEE